MRQKIFLLCLMISLLTLALISRVASASIYFAGDYIIQIPTANLTFVMLAPEDFFVSHKDSVIREKYSESGFYDIKDATNLIQRIDWYAEEQHVHITSDGKHLVRVGGLAPSNSNLGVAFYEDGELIKSYPRHDLEKLDLFLLYPSNPSSLYYSHHRSYELKEETQEFFVRVQEKEVFIFDSSTGELISGRLIGTRNNIFIIIWMTAFIAIVLGLPLYGLYRLVKRLFFT